MAFPDDRLVHRLQAAFGADADAEPTTWSWTDITADIHAQQITITRGTANEAGQAEPTSISLVLDNVSGDYTPDNPLGAYYPGVDLGVPLRYSMQGPAYLGLEGIGRASTPDATVLDITGPIDIRIEVALDDWASGEVIELAGKYRNVGNQRSWLMTYGTEGTLIFRWSPDGIAITQHISTEAVPVPASGRVALRSTLDTTTGVVTHYTAPSIDGPWTQLGDASAAAGATSLFNSSEPVDIGDVAGIGFSAGEGAFYAFQLYDGIDGALVADVDFTAQTPGDTVFTDDAGLTWTLAGAAEITDWHQEFTGHVDSWEPVWPYGDLSDEDTDYEGESQVTVTASGILRRLGQGEDALDSTLRRRIPFYAPLAYWPMEDGTGATQASSPVEGVAPLKLTQAQWASANTLPSSSPLPVLASSGSDLPHMLGRIPAPSSTLTSWSVNYIYRLDTPNAATRTFMRILSTGTVAEWYIQQASGGSDIIGRDADGNTVFSQGIATGLDLYGQWVRVRFRAAQNGGNVDWRIDWTDVGGAAGGFDASFAGTVGRPTGVASPPDGYSPLLDGMALGHITAFPVEITAAYDGAIDAWAGETAGNRFARLCEEEGIPYAVVGDRDDTEPMGPQRPAPLLTLLAECAALDGGRLGERRSARGLQYRTRTDLYNQSPRMVLDAAVNEIANPFAPVLDDQRIRNDITVSREGGSSARVVDEASVTKRRRYRDSPTLNAASDVQLPALAGWRLHLGTWPGMRYPSVTADLSIAPQLIGTWLQSDTGDRLQVVNLPPQHPTDTVDLLLEGYTQTISPTRWTVQGNCTPAGPWDVAVYDTDHRDTAGSELAAAIDGEETTAPVLTSLGPLWTTANPALNANADFETDLTGWSASGSAIARVPTPGPAPFPGSWSVQMTPDGVSQFPNVGSDLLPVTVGQTYVISGYLRCATTRSVALNVNWFGAGGTYITTDANDKPVIAGVWTWFERTVTAPVGAVTANLAPTVADFPPATDVLMADEVTLRPVGGTPQDFPFLIRAGGEVMAVTAVTPSVLDTFTRTTTPGWGTPDIGEAWVSTGGAADDHFTQGSEAAHELTGVDVARLDLTPVAGTDFEVEADIATAALATGGPQLVSVVARAADGDNLYMAQLSISTTQTITLTLRKRVAGVETQLDTFTTTLTHAAFAFYRVRLKVSGSQLRARVRLASSADRGNWQVSATDTSLTAGSSIGLRSVRQTANTNANLIVSYDNVQLLNPQQFHLERSDNGIVKAQTSGTDVVLAKPAIRAL